MSEAISLTRNVFGGEGHWKGISSPGSSTTRARSEPEAKREGGRKCSSTYGALTSLDMSKLDMSKLSISDMSQVRKHVLKASADGFNGLLESCRMK